MKRITFLAAVIAGLFLFGAQSALADDCALLSGNPPGAECVVNTARTVTGTFNIAETLHITGAGSIDATGGGITLNVTGDFLMDKPTAVGGGDLDADDPILPAGAGASDITIVASGKVILQAGTEITADNRVGSGAPGNITITTGGDMTMCGPAGAQAGCGGASAFDGALISAQNGSTVGATVKSITITVGDKNKATGNFYMEGGDTTYGLETGALIDTTTQAGHAGNINVTAGKSYFTEPGAVIQAGAPLGGTTATAQGGKIFLVSDCAMTSEGRVTSKGPDFGADLVHLESCTVIIRGLVESTAKGHVGNAPNSCDLVNDGLPGEVLRNHPALSTGCIEVWGNTIEIDSTVNPNAQPLPINWAGELNADIGDGGPDGTSWIDIFAQSGLTITDGTGNDFVRNNNSGHTYLSVYAVHANTMDGSDNNPSVITAYVKNGPLVAKGDGEANGGRVFEASATLTNDTGHYGADTFIGNGSKGGTIDVEASGVVTLDTSLINAAGDFAPETTTGGKIIVKSWGVGVGAVSWKKVSGDVRPDATGTIVINACLAIDLTGTDFHGEVPSTATGGANCNAAQPPIPTITAANGGPVFKTALWALCGGGITISGMKFDDLNANGVNDSDPGLDGWTIHLFGKDINNNPVHLTQVTAGGGLYSFTNVPPGTYNICEQVLVATPPWQQTFPTAGHICTTAEDPDNTSPGHFGYTVTVGQSCTAQGCGCFEDVTGKDFGNVQLATKSGLKFNDLDGDHARDGSPLEPGLDGWVIHLFGKAVNNTNVHQTSTTTNGGKYSFSVLPGDYTVCEALKAGWNQTFPVGPAVGIADCVATPDPAADNPTPGKWGYSIHLNSGDQDTDNDFGNQQTQSQCPEDPTAVLTSSVDPSGANHGVANFLTLQPAYDAAANGAVIGIFGKWKENVNLGGAKTLKITQCTSAQITAADNSLPVWEISSTGKLTIVGPDSVGGTIGWLIDNLSGGPHTLKSVRANGASVWGIKITSDGNNVSWNDVSGNGNGVTGGILVTGKSNTLKGGTTGPNNGDGVKITGDSNTLSGATVNGNTGNGVIVTGNSNQIKGNSASSNTLDGFNNNNAGTSNTYSGNSSNKGSSGSSTENGGAEYNFVTTGGNGGSNRADGVGVPSAAKGCISFAAGQQCE